MWHLPRSINANVTSFNSVFEESIGRSDNWGDYDVLAIRRQCGDSALIIALNTLQ
jgi:hypothetical protein